MNKFYFFSLIFLLSGIVQLLNLHGVKAIDKKSYSIIHTSSVPRIDGNLDDECWKKCNSVSDFITYLPQFGKQPTFKTEVKVIYDDDAIYISAKMFDEQPQNIGRSLTLRDQGMDQDYFLAGFDTYLDGQSAYRFRVSASNVQTDERIKNDNLDVSWDAVWDSKTKIDMDGWSIEIKVPYSAIRFPNKPVQEWGLQFNRYIKRSGEFVIWSPVDPNQSGIVSQWGLLKGIENIHPPFRLSLTPYIAGYFDRAPISFTPIEYNNSYSYNGGMDLKLGINESFTLDATLIPDFGQVQSDNTVLNLSPFEIQYDEKRPFFTEGTDLFQIGEIFYSRRIGGMPENFYSPYFELQDGEKIISNPTQSQLYNATKISGRTKTGLGIGVLNAVQAPTYAEIENVNDGTKRKIQTGVLTNYNVLVFNQTLKNNSEISFINTNVIRDASARDANVSAIDFTLRDKKNNYMVQGRGKYSHLFDEKINDSLSQGGVYFLMFSKVSGKFRFDISEHGITPFYNSNDLGINGQTDLMQHFVGIKYVETEQHGNILNWNWYWGNNYSNKYSTGDYYDFNINTGGEFTTKKFWSFSTYIQSKPFWYYDYYEPRVEGKKFLHAPWVYINQSITTDYRKPFTLTASVEWAESPQPKDPLVGAGISPQWQATNWLNVGITCNYTFDHSNWGFVSYIDSSDLVIMGRRDSRTVSNDFYMQLLFNPHMNLSAHARHYWTEVKYWQFYNLQNDGNVTESNFTGNYDINFNAWNVDVVYAWQFARGSFLNLIWKVNSLNEDQQITHKYFDNFQNTLKLPSGNTIALKMIYYLDYQTIKKIVR